MDNISKLVGARIRGFRKEKHLSQEELAENAIFIPLTSGSWNAERKTRQ